MRVATQIREQGKVWGKEEAEGIGRHPEQARNGLNAALGSITASQNMPQLAAQLTEVLAARDRAPDQQLPDTGIDLELERSLSSCFIQLAQYGTRATSVVLQDYQGNSCFYEQSFDAQGPTQSRCFELQMPLIGTRLKR